ncbi:MAG: hypothetical protein MJZ76_01490 [Bacteroidales bacterium]|nr:hypothetical protein [Bacteroidales bacterium]
MSENTNNKFRLRKPSMTFMVCLLIAITIWFLGKFSKMYTARLDFRIECIDLPDNLDHITLSDSVCTIVFKTRGFNLLQSDYSESNRKLELSVEKLIQNKRKNLYNYTFTNKELTEFLKENGFYEDEFVEIENPEKIILYLK